jgi:hypothetical protein
MWSGLRWKVAESFDRLTEKQCFVLKLYWGLEGHGRHSFEKSRRSWASSGRPSKAYITERWTPSAGVTPTRGRQFRPNREGENGMTKGTARLTTQVRPEDRDRLQRLAESHDRTVAAEIRRALGCYFEVAEGPVWTPLSEN